MATKYYNISIPSDPKITGLKDAGSQAEILRNGFSDKSNYDTYYKYFHGAGLELGFERSKTLPPFPIKLEYIKMEEKAVLNDFVTFRPYLMSGQFLVSDKVVRILSTVRLVDHKFYPVTIDFKGKVITNYKLLFMPPLDFSLIDYSKSLFYTGLNLPENRKNMRQFNDYEEYQRFGLKNLVNTERIVLKSGFDRELDYFEVRLSSLPFISEYLKGTFEIAEVTGIDIKEAKHPELVFEEEIQKK